MKSRFSGFSLVEVTIALGIIAFCVVSVFGLLPLALRSVKDASDRRSAVEIMNLVSGDLLSRSSSSTNHLSGWFSNIVIDQPSTQILKVTENGQQDENFQQGKILLYNLRIAITPSSPTNAGTAQLSVAWPLTAQYVGTNSPTGWTNAQGSVRTVVYFNE